MKRFDQLRTTDGLDAFDLLSFLFNKGRIDAPIQPASRAWLTGLTEKQLGGY